MLEFLPPSVRGALKNLNDDLIYEIRLRSDCPVKINYRGEYIWLGIKGIVKQRESAIKVTAREVADCVFAASGYSVYSVSEQMKECFLTTAGGIRLGLAGTLVRDNGKIKALRDVTSVCVRVPHPITNCADLVFRLCEEDELRNCILLSVPGYGKTTILRELCRLLDERYPEKNILVADERGEISAFGTSGADVLKFAQKKDAFSFGLRALRPDIVITDELQEEDYGAVQRLMDAGLIVIASAHFGKDFAAFEHKIFQRYVYIGRRKIGQADAVYDQNGQNLL